MHLAKLLFVPVLSVLIVGCGSTQKITKVETLDKSWNLGDYSQVYETSKVEIEKSEKKGKDAAAMYYTFAGKAALKLNDVSAARTNLEKALSITPESEDLYPYLVEVYQRIDNLSYEISTLENYRKRFPQGKYTSQMNEALFKAYVESENWEKAIKGWQELTSEDVLDPSYLELYIKVLDELNLKTELNETVEQLLNVDAKNQLALTYKATEIYKSAEERYKKEMALYNARKTRKQYGILLKALEKSTDEFKQARDMFETIYQQSKSDEVAGYLANIYARLNNQQKSEYYKKLAL